MDDDGTVDVEAIIEIIPEEVKEKGAPIIRTCGSKGSVSVIFLCWKWFLQL